MRRLVLTIDRGGRLRALVDSLARFVVTNPLGLIVLATPTAVTLFLQPKWLMWFGIMTPDSSLVPNAAAAIGFSTAFGFGWLLHRQVGLLEIWRRRWLINLLLAVGLTTAGLSITGIAPLLTPAAHTWLTAVYAACYTLAIWRWTFAVVGMSLRFLSNYSSARRYIADSSYWLYLIHVPLIMALQVAVSRLAWAWWVKFPLILLVAFPLMFATYHLLVRHSFIGAILNGRRESRSKEAVARPAMQEVLS